MQFEYDPELLIEEVKKRPGIWKFDDESYRSREMRHRLWTEIVDELIQQSDGVNISKCEKRELELQLQKKWKSIRDCFQKYWQRPNRTRRPYIYYKQLTFLIKNQDGDDVTEPDQVRQRKWVGPRKRMKIVKEEESSPDDNEDNYPNEEITFTNDDEDEITVPSKVARSSRYDEFAFANVDAKNDSDDPDKMFLVSLLPHLKAIPEELRLDAKMEMMNVLRNSKYNNKIL